MKLLELIVKEYLSIVKVLEEKEPVENSRIVIEREQFRKLLERYSYMSFREKTKVYKDLNFIIHDKNNYTMPCKDTTLRKTVRRVVFNYNAYITLKRLYDTTVD